MSKIYIARKDVFGLGEHSYWVYDPDGDPTTGDERVIRGGTVFQSDPFADPRYLIEVDRPLADSRDSLNGADPYDDRWYTTIFDSDDAGTSVQDVSDKWDDMIVRAKEVAGNPTQTAQDPVYTSYDAYFLTEDNYNFFNSNCNCLTNTVGQAAGVDFGEFYPVEGGASSSGQTVSFPEYQFWGTDTLFGTPDDETFTYDPENAKIADQGGSDTYVIDSSTFSPDDPPLWIFEDTDPATTNILVLEGFDLEDIIVARYGPDIHVFLPGDTLVPSVVIKDQYPVFGTGTPKIDGIQVNPSDGPSQYLPLGDISDVPPNHTFDKPDWVEGVLGGIVEGESTPLVLDIDGDGIELAALNGTGSVYWDIDLDGFAEASGWIAGGDGLLAIDLNADGIINDHSELFGDQTGSPNGFAALAMYDTNADNAITSADAQFGDLLVWIDTHPDGYSQENELHTLSDLSITSINLNFANVSYAISDNEIKQESNFVIDGQTRDIVDVWFAFDNVNSVYAEDYQLDARTFSLPNLRGFGNLPNLDIAMSLDETLVGMVQELTIAGTSEALSSTFDIETKLEEILFRWAGVDDVSPTSRGAYMDARKLEFLETLRDEPYQGTGTNPGTVGAGILEEVFQEALSNFATQLFAQTSLKPLLFDDAVYSPWTGELQTTTPINIVWFLDDYTGINTTDTVNDLYFYSLNGGTVDNIHDAGGYDQILFGSDVSPEDVRLVTDGYNLDLFVGGDEIEIYRQFFPTGDYQIETAKFSDGTEIDLLNNVTFTGSASADNMYGTVNNDTLVGSGGNDNLYGKSGDDVYRYSLGDGSDTIRDESGAADQLVFDASISIDDVRLWKDGNDLELYIGSEKITLYRQFLASYDYHIESMKFSDDTVIDLTDNLTFTGTSSAESVNGTANDDTLVGSGGDDYLYGQAGSDTFLYSLGDGSDTIRDSAGSADQIVFGTGIDVDDVRLWRNSNDLDLYIGSEKITLYRQFNATDDYYIESMKFDDDTVVDLSNDLTLTGTSSGEYMYGTLNDDVLYGAEGADNIYGYAGADTFAWLAEDVDGSVDTLKDFSTSDGDMLDISDVIEAYDPVTDAITDFVWMVNAGSNTDVYVDTDGAGVAEVWTKIATIQNVTGLTDEAALETNGTLIAA